MTGRWRNTALGRDKQCASVGLIIGVVDLQRQGTVSGPPSLASCSWPYNLDSTDSPDSRHWPRHPIHFTGVGYPQSDPSSSVGWCSGVLARTHTCTLAGPAACTVWANADRVAPVVYTSSTNTMC